MRARPGVRLSVAGIAPPLYWTTRSAMLVAPVRRSRDVRARTPRTRASSCSELRLSTPSPLTRIGTGVVEPMVRLTFSIMTRAGMSWGTNVFSSVEIGNRRVERDPDEGHEADDGEQGQGVLRDPDREGAEEPVVPGRLVDLCVDPLRPVVDQPGEDGDADQRDHVAGRDPDDRDEGEAPDHRDRREVEGGEAHRGREHRVEDGRTGVLHGVADRLDKRPFARLLLEPGRGTGSRSRSRARSGSGTRRSRPC